ncbi:hypothetical protein L218DRAFT_1081790 [Marasmius fiardii PR-910]|nr:hypothetical protein L218DRAFT_1081790 [Marasmius fiardii PR-910]
MEQDPLLICQAQLLELPPLRPRKNLHVAGRNKGAQVRNWKLGSAIWNRRFDGVALSSLFNLECFQVYSVSIRQRHRAQATGNHPETIARKEYICPLCKSLGNVIIPVTNPPNASLNSVPFADWIRSAGISILKSKLDPQLESLQFRNGTGEFVFWSAQDPGYTSIFRNQEKVDGSDPMKMVDTVMAVSKSLSQQTRHLRDRNEPKPGERGAGIYLPEELIGYSNQLYWNCASRTRTVIGLVFILNKGRGLHTTHLARRAHEDIFGDVRMFFISVVRHSPIFKHTATLAFETFGEARIEKFLHAFTLPFLRKAAILCHSVLPSAFPLQTPSDDGNPQPQTQSCEYTRLLSFLGIPPLSDLPNQDTLQNALSGWCTHYGHSHAVSPVNFGVTLDLPAREVTVGVGQPFCRSRQGGGLSEVQHYSSGSGDMFALWNHGVFPECGGAMGLYFLVKRCIVLYLYGNSRSFTQSPYLDVHGEIDVSMRRGRRQYLHHTR